MPVSPRLAIPWPALSDSADGPDLGSDIANSLIDTAVVYGQGLLANRPVSTAGSPGLQGRMYYAIDTFLHYWDTGTGWVSIAPIIGQDSLTAFHIAPDAITQSELAPNAVGTPEIQDNAITNSKLADAIVGTAEIAAALKPSQGAGAGTEALRTLGTAPGQALPGDYGPIQQLPTVMESAYFPPANPPVYKQVILVDTIGNPSWRWNLMYNPYSVSAHKWEVIGGDEISAFYGAQIGLSGDWTLRNPALYIPRSGEYEVTWGCYCELQSGSRCWNSLGGCGFPTHQVYSAVAGTSGGGYNSSVNVYNTMQVNVSCHLYVGLSPGTLQFMNYWQNDGIGGAMAQCYNGWIVAKPSRIS